MMRCYLETYVTGSDFTTTLDFVHFYLDETFTNFLVSLLKESLKNLLQNSRGDSFY